MKKKKAWGDRRDATWIRDVDALHGIVPYIYPNRTDNEAFIQENIQLEPIYKYLERKNRSLAEGEDPYKLFHVILAAVVKTITLRPKMNRFIKGGRMYQRDELSLAFVIKKEFHDHGEEALAFISFDEDTTIEEVRKKISEEIHVCRGEKPDNTTAFMDKFMKLPRGILRFVIWIIHKLDYYGKVPYFLVKKDPNFSSCFVTNLGSIGLKAGYHHLSNWGTNSLFLVLGEKKRRPVWDEDGNMTVQEIMGIGMTLDERIADGYYYSKTVKLLKYILQNPEVLDKPAKEEINYELL